MGRDVWVPVVSGPLAPYAAGFASWLRPRAYSPPGDGRRNSADIDRPPLSSRSSRSSDYVARLARQTLTPQEKSLTTRPVFNITVRGT